MILYFPGSYCQAAVALCVCIFLTFRPTSYFMAILFRLSCTGRKAIGRELPQSLRNVAQADDIIHDWNYTPVEQSLLYHAI